MPKVENVVIKSSPWRNSDIPILFEKEDVYYANSNDIASLMKELGIYKSISEARRANRHGEIPLGYSHEFKASKKIRLYIWNPSE
jgi:hypothetical protein